MMSDRWILTLALLAGADCRECGQEEIDARDITGCTSVEHMRYVGHSNAVWLGDALHHNADLQVLDLHHTKIGDDDALSLAAGLHNNTHLKRLRLHNNKIFDVGAAALGRALLANDALEFLSLSSNGVGDDGAKALADGLRGNRVLRRLDLYFNMVGDVGATALADALKVNRGLRTLHLDTNRVGDPGGLALAAALRSERGGLLSASSKAPNGLGELSLSYNQITNEGGDALLAVPASNEVLHALTLDHNQMIHGATRQKLDGAHAEMMAERQAVATWLVDSGLLQDGWYSADGPPLATGYAAAVVGLQAHTRDGVLALRHLSEAELAAHKALASLAPAERTALARVVSAKVVELTAHDEL